MKMNRSTEQALFVLLVLGSQKGHTPVKSGTLARVLDVSDSYLKKVLKHMADARLIQSAPGREGGYQLARPLGEISFATVFTALEGFEAPTSAAPLARAIFESGQHLEESLDKVMGTFQQATEAFEAQLASLTLDQLLLPEVVESGVVEWDKR